MEPDYRSMDEDDDSYIEIKIDAWPLPLSSSSSPPSPYTSKVHDDEYHRHHQLRISISSTISLPLQKDDEEDDDHRNEYPCISSLVNFNGDDTVNNNNDNSNTTILFNNTPVGVGLIMESNNNNYAHKFEAQTTVQGGTHHMDAPCSRRLPNMTTTKNGGMMKLLIKVRGINIGATLASLIKPLYQHNKKNGHNKSSSSKKYFQCYQKNLVNPTNTRRSNNNNNNNNNNWEFEEDEIMCGSFRSCKKSSTKVEMDLGAIRGIFNAMGMNIISNNKKGSSKSKRRSQPNSCDTTPIHEGFSSYTNNNNNNNDNNNNNNNISIQAAIAYCKSSFNQTSDFSF